MAGAVEVTLRKVQAGELDWLDTIAADVFDEAPKRQFLKPFLSDAGNLLLLAIAEGQVIGKCTAMVHRRPDKPAELYIDEIDVTPLFRRRGIAKQMVAKMLEMADELDCEECWLGTEIDNMPARKLYESYGAESEEIMLYYLEY